MKILAQIVTWYVNICELYWYQDTDNITVDVGTFMFKENTTQLEIYENKDTSFPI